MCGILATLLTDHTSLASVELFEGLQILQHRGQDAAGIVTCGQKGRLYQCKGNGMVRDVFNQEHLQNLVGNLGIGHVRYPTAGSSSHSEAQPFYVNSPYGIVFAHNGNLINADELKNFLDFTVHRHINTDSDSELLLNIFANNLQKTNKARINEQDIFTAIRGIYEQCIGAYACVAMIAGFGIIGFRDLHGIRPICYGTRQGVAGIDYMFASESVVLDHAGFTDVKDINPGEAVIITKTAITKRQLISPEKIAPCIFEFVYFARPDSVIDGISVYRSRLEMGEYLADQVIKKCGENLDIDVVPDTSRVAALQVSHKLKIAYREGFIKNRYVGRTFIMSGQQIRTTSKEIVQMARDAELVAYDRDVDSIAKEIGADMVIYQELEDLISSCRKFNSNISKFDCSVFNGCYVTSGITQEYLDKLENTLNSKSHATAASKQRKERLEALRKRKLDSESTNTTTTTDENNNDNTEKKLKFRNYTPINEEIIKATEKIHIATPDDLGETLEKQANKLTKEVEAADEAKRAEEVNPNWDLKRDVEKKLEKLNKRTQDISITINPDDSDDEKNVTTLTTTVNLADAPPVRAEVEKIIPTCEDDEEILDYLKELLKHVQQSSPSQDEVVADSIINNQSTFSPTPSQTVQQSSQDVEVVMDRVVNEPFSKRIQDDTRLPENASISSLLQ
ncbi:8481_t:CDS:10 [Diversispora eburnea]|uniref:8481_t:CDS:1 n=1 Tax=Diversispora eburnea TaxID=1213867 RepID=A0A9N9ABP6_9GLOM|nr:8481_t:CDS:10 [Diversispora eburnea]